MTDDIRDLQRDVDEAVGELDERNNVVIGDPISLTELAEILREYDNDGG